MKTQNRLEMRTSAFTSTNDIDQEQFFCDIFEEKHNLLESLTLRQLELIQLLVSPSKPKRILNLGYGVGVSAVVLHEKLFTGQTPSIFAVDINNTTFFKDKSKYQKIPGIHFLKGEPENLNLFFHERFDGVIYTPSFYQVPNFGESLRQASNIVTNGGVVTSCHFSGFFTEDGEDIILKAFPESRYNKAVVHKKDIETIFRQTTGFRLTCIDYQFETESDFIEDLLFSPVNTHPLFPKLSWNERIAKLQRIRQVVEEYGNKIFVGWRFIIAIKERQREN